MVSSRVGGIAEVIEDEVTGSTFALGDVEGLIAGVRRAFSDLGFRGRTIEAAKKLVGNRYDCRRIARAHLALYDELVQPRELRIS